MRSDWLGISLSLFQVVAIKAIGGVRLSGAEEVDAFRHMTGGRKEHYVGHEFMDVTLIMAARSGKSSRISAPLALYAVLRASRTMTPAPGERLCAACVAQNLDAAKIVFNFAKERAIESKYMSALIVGDPQGR